MPDPTVPECIDRASALIRSAAVAHSQDEKIRFLEDAERWLQRAKQQLLDARAKSGGDRPEP